jgi:hypothetical protein
MINYKNDLIKYVSQSELHLVSGEQARIINKSLLQGCIEFQNWFFIGTLTNYLQR